ncbi:WD40 repeat-like protein [Lentinus brumalis]|uniref:WD40 repeat-like protein n=1 Tax=Lentinus brumalis TaxID=2498619 RepID=A0A371CJB7_9APHY|nr:WD40 repeat-like protein [Polyporus brumalis]
MSREYSELGRLQGGHSAAITAIAISPRATYLASAGLDNRVCVWELSSGKLLYEYNGSSAAVSLAWLPAGEDRILCSMLDGYVVSLSFSVAAITARGFVVHSEAVECLVIKGQRVASGAHREVRVWDWTTDGPWTLHYEVEEPLSHQHEEVLVTGLSWDDSTGKTRLVVAYLEHGIRWVSLPVLRVNGSK